MKVEEVEKVKALSFGAVVSNIVKRCLESGDPPSRVVCPETINALSPLGLREAARVGLVSDANNFFHRIRTQPQTSGKGEASKGANGRVRHGYVVVSADVLEIPLVGATGELKTLLEFTADDCGFLMLEAQGQKAAWRDREKWASRAHMLIKQSRSATKVKELPKTQVAELRELAKDVWS